jgi:hypothetical protein
MWILPQTPTPKPLGTIAGKTRVGLSKNLCLAATQMQSGYSRKSTKNLTRSNHTVF